MDRIDVDMMQKVMISSLLGAKNCLFCDWSIADATHETSWLIYGTREKRYNISCCLWPFLIFTACPLVFIMEFVLFDLLLSDFSARFHVSRLGKTFLGFRLFLLRDSSAEEC